MIKKQNMIPMFKFEFVRLVNIFLFRRHNKRQAMKCADPELLAMYDQNARSSNVDRRHFA